MFRVAPQQEMTVIIGYDDGTSYHTMEEANPKEIANIASWSYDDETIMYATVVVAGEIVWAFSRGGGLVFDYSYPDERSYDTTVSANDLD